jgi:hypothetical protein
LANIPFAEFDIIRGTTETLIANLFKTDGTALDLTGNSSMNLYVAPTINTTSPTITKAVTVASGYAASAGVVTYAFVPSDTLAITPGDYVAEIHITYGSGTEYRTELPFLFRIKERVKT